MTDTAMVHKRLKQNHAWRYLSTDICTEILVYLPVSAVLRFRSVCKQWCSIIDEPQFKQEHLRHALEHRTETKTVIVFKRRYKSRIQANDVPARAVVLDGLESPLRHLWSAPSPAANIKMIGTCNGLLCFYDKRKQVIRLDNPVIRESLSLTMVAKSTRAKIVGERHKTYCLGFHPMTQQYKIIHLPVNLGDKFDVMQVYTLGEKSWREVRTPDAGYDMSSIVSVNGAIYWLSHRYEQVISFDLKTEHVTFISHPSFDVSKTFHVSLMETNAGLCVAIHERLDTEPSFSGQDIKIWCLEDGREQIWSSKYRVHLERPGHWMPQYFIHWEHFVISAYFDKWYAHKLRERDFMRIHGESGIKLINSKGIWGQTFPYLDSFAPLKIYTS